MLLLATLLSGERYFSAMKLPKSGLCRKLNDNDHALKASWRAVGLVIVDECSFLSRSQLSVINQRMKQLGPMFSEKTFAMFTLSSQATSINYVALVPPFSRCPQMSHQARSQAKMRKSIRKRAKKDKSRIHAKLINSTRIEQLSSSMLHPTSIIGITIELSSSPIRPTSKSCHDEDKTTQILIKYLSKSVYNRSPLLLT